jgi:hypothetical protein
MEIELFGQMYDADALLQLFVSSWGFGILAGAVAVVVTFVYGRDGD